MHAHEDNNECQEHCDTNEVKQPIAMHCKQRDSGHCTGIVYDVELIVKGVRKPQIGERRRESMQGCRTTHEIIVPTSHIRCVSEVTA